MATEDGTPERDEFDVDVVPGQRRGAHRAQSPPIVVALLAALAALLVVAMLVTVIALVRTGFSSTGIEAAPPTSTTKPAPVPTTEPIQPEIDRGASLVLLNGTAYSRATRTARTQLQRDGWIVNRIGSNEDRTLDATVVLYADPTLARTAETLAEVLGGGTVSQVPPEDLDDDEDLRVLVGRDFLVSRDLVSATGTSTRSGTSAPDEADRTATSTRTTTGSTAGPTDD